MLINEQFRKCVTFLYTDVEDRGADKRVAVGSVFFVAAPLFDDPAEGTASAIYAVTARHVVDFPPVLWMRIRLQSGGFQDYPVPKDAWIHSASTDVAVAVTGFDDSWDIKAIPTGSFLTPLLADKPDVAPVGEGDAVFFSGLFVGHYGKGVPQPIMRFGNISLMPREPVRIQISKHPHTETDIEAYLVEARSWGGQSGSPAFLMFTSDREAGIGGNFIIGGLMFALLGVVQGGWRTTGDTKAPDPSGEGWVEVNMGISVVIPDSKITEVLMSDELRAHRAELRQVSRSGSLIAPTADVAESGRESEFERFEDLTRKLVNTPKPKDESES